jgi:hypothetical protein
MTSTENIVKLTGPESWKEWNLRFINMAQDNQLWDVINPASTSKGDFMERPTEPRFADYPNLNHASGLVAAISASVTTALAALLPLVRGNYRPMQAQSPPWRA